METSQVIIRKFPVELRKQLKIISITKGISMADIIISLIEDYIEKNNKEE